MQRGSGPDALPFYRVRRVERHSAMYLMSRLLISRRGIPTRTSRTARTRGSALEEGGKGCLEKNCQLAVQELRKGRMVDCARGTCMPPRLSSSSSSSSLPLSAFLHLSLSLHFHSFTHTWGLLQLSSRDSISSAARLVIPAAVRAHLSLQSGLARVCTLIQPSSLPSSVSSSPSLQYYRTARIYLFYADHPARYRVHNWQAPSPP
jgi:hypothetical protein